MPGRKRPTRCASWQLSSVPRCRDGTPTATACTSSSSPTGNRSWVQRLVIRRRRRELGLGTAGLVSLAEARELALATASSPAPGAIPSPRSVARTAFPPSPGRRARARTEARRLARPVARTELVAEHGAVRVPARRPPARLRGQHGRRVGDPHAHLARQGGDGQGGPPAHPLGAGEVCRQGLAERQPVAAAEHPRRGPLSCERRLQWRGP